VVARAADPVSEYPDSANRGQGAHGVTRIDRGTDCGGVFSTAIPEPARTASKLSLNFASRSRTKNRNAPARSSRAMKKLRQPAMLPLALSAHFQSE
jgi:hypothetical protein